MFYFDNLTDLTYNQEITLLEAISKVILASPDCELRASLSACIGEIRFISPASAFANRLLSFRLGTTNYF
jgi:hypothetical protein